MGRSGPNRGTKWTRGDSVGNSKGGCGCWRDWEGTGEPRRAETVHRQRSPPRRERVENLTGLAAYHSTLRGEGLGLDEVRGDMAGLRIVHDMEGQSLASLSECPRYGKEIEGMFLTREGPVHWQIKDLVQLQHLYFRGKLWITVVDTFPVTFKYNNKTKSRYKKHEQLSIRSRGVCLCMGPVGVVSLVFFWYGVSSLE